MIVLFEQNVPFLNEILLCPQYNNYYYRFVKFDIYSTDSINYVKDSYKYIKKKMKIEH